MENYTPTFEELDELQRQRYQLLTHGPTIVEFALLFTVKDPDTQKISLVDGVIDAGVANHYYDAFAVLSNSNHSSGDLLSATGFNKLELDQFTTVIGHLADLQPTQS